MEKLRKIAALAILVFLTFAIVSSALPVRAATKAEIDAAITSGVAWLAADQQADGSWPLFWENVATTGLAVLKLEHYAYEKGYASPFDPAYAYHQNVEKGLDYLFGASMLVKTIGPQDHTAGATGTVDNPDSNGNGLGVYSHGSSYPFDVYDTGIVLSVISASGTPTRTVNVLGSAVDGWTYFNVAQDMTDWLAWAQSDSNDPRYGSLSGEGGWSYGAMDNTGTGTSSYGADNSNSGYAVLGLAYAKDFGCTVPQWVKTELNAYINDIQDPVNGDPNDGGSWYHQLGDAIGVNILKTGNLLFEMALVGDTPVTARVVAALNYLKAHWGDASGGNEPPGWDGNPANYQAMFTAMKGLEYMGVNTFSGIDWYADFTDVIVAQQSVDGSWQSSSERGNPTIITAWALLTLERVSRAPEAPVASFTESLHTAKVGESISFDATSSNDPDGTIVLYEWDWESDGIYDATGVTASHPYSVPGTYIVTLRVTDNDGLKDTVTDTKTIIAYPLTVHIQPTSATINLGQSVTFTSTVQGGTPPYTYQWYLNGNPVSGATSNGWIFIPSTAGIHYVYLQAADFNNITAQSETARIVVTSVPVGGYSVSFGKQITVKPLTLNFALVIGLALFLVAFKRKTTKRRA